MATILVPFGTVKTKLSGQKIRNTATGLQETPTAVRESAAGLGLEPSAPTLENLLAARLTHDSGRVETSAIIDVGTATVAALRRAGRINYQRA